jgi:multiple sugar transport system ATP-binding protein
MNLVAGRLQAGIFTGENIRVEGMGGAGDGPVTLGFRAEDAAIVPSGGQITAPIYSLELLGEASMVSLRVGGELVSIKASKDFAAEIGSPISATVPARACHFFDRQSGKRIGSLAA